MRRKSQINCFWGLCEVLCPSSLLQDSSSLCAFCFSHEKASANLLSATVCITWEQRSAVSVLGSLENQAVFQGV